MAYDPLHQTTRRARTQLVAFSAALIIVNVFQVELRDIPLQGIDIAFGSALLPVALTGGMLWFLVSFHLYRIDDAKYEPTPADLKEFRDRAVKDLDARKANLKAALAECLEGVSGRELERLAAKHGFEHKTIEYRPFVGDKIDQWVDFNVIDGTLESTLVEKPAGETTGHTVLSKLFSNSFEKFFGDKGVSHARSALDLSITRMAEIWKDSYKEEEMMRELRFPRASPQKILDLYFPYILAGLSLITAAWRFGQPFFKDNTISV